ncbi:YqiA/YcfP family alpha/beta fold hydrolase, partial [Kaarinaea lacus]
FSSGSASTKATILKQKLTPITVIVPEYPSHRPRESIVVLNQIIARNATSRHTDKLMIIGSSLGGYYAQYLAHTLDVISGVVLINPALQPQLTLKPCIGQQANMVTGKTFEFSKRDFDELMQFDIPEESIHVPTLVLLDEADEVIKCQYAALRYKNSGRVIIYPGGNHWFAHLHDAVPEITAFYQSLA